MRRFLFLTLAMASLLTGCTLGDPITPGATEAAVETASLLAARDRLDIPEITSVRLAGGRATATWRRVTDAAGYQLVSCDTGSLPTVEKKTSQDTVQLFTGLIPGERYGVKLRARKATGSASGDANNSKFSDCRRWVGAEPVATILLAPATAQLMVGESQQMTATLLDRLGAVLTDRDLSWASSTPAVVSVNAAGVITAAGPGSVVVTVTSEGVVASATITVLEPVASITISPTVAQLDVGQMQLFTATPRDRFGATLNGRVVTWMSSSSTVATVSALGLVQGVTAGSTIITATSEGRAVSATVTVRLPGWTLLASRGAVPAILTASAYAAGSDAIFAGNMPDFGTGSLWRFDLASSTWARLTSNGWPIGKYRKLIYDSTRRRLVTYWDGLGQVYSIPETGGTWTPDGAAGNSEQYYEAYAFHNPVSGKLSVFAGYGFGTFKNTLWEWNGSNAWTVMQVSGSVPSPRFGAQANVVVDAAASRAFFTQRWLGATPGMGDDLWVFDLRSYAFRNLIPHYTGPDARGGSGMAYDVQTRTLYRYGGMTLQGFTVTSDFVRATPDDAVVQWSAMPASSSSPGVRYQPGLHYDQARRRLVLVSGFDGANWIGDVWTYPVP
jgi:hypothetical protein